MAGERSETHFGDYLTRAETGIYSILAVLFYITALAAIVGAGNNSGMVWLTGRTHSKRWRS